jgi:hypothetical protein
MDGVSTNRPTPIAAFLTLTRSECKLCEEALGKPALESMASSSHDEINEDATD